MSPISPQAACNLSQLLQQVHLVTPKAGTLYDRNARPVINIKPPDWAVLQKGNAAAGSSGEFVIILGEVKNPGRKLLQITGMMEGRPLLATGASEVILVQPKSNRNLAVSCVIPYPESRRGLYGLDFSSDDTIRQLLKTSFAGWHHAYHEVFATGTGFALKTMRRPAGIGA